MESEDFEQIETAIYEAAIIPEKWSAVLDDLATATNAVGGVFFGVSTVNAAWVASGGLHDRMVEFVASGWATRNTRMEIGIRKGLHLMPRFVTEADYYGPDGIEKEAIYTEFFLKQGLGHSAGTIALVPHQDMLCISFERGLDRGPFLQHELTRLESLRPHLMRASVVTARLGLQQLRTAVETLSALGLPAAAVSESGVVLEANAQFAEATHIWTTRGANRLALHDGLADTMLSESLSALRLARVKRSIPVRAAPDGPLTAVVQMVPMRRLALDIFGNTAAIVVLSEPKSEDDNAALLLSLFDLTPAELDVARGIAAGQTVNGIAKARGRSVATIRNQLRSVMSKTGSSRQIDLIILLRSFAAV